MGGSRVSLRFSVHFMLFCRQLFLFKINVFEKFVQEYHQSVKLFGSRSGPINPVCKGYQQMTIVGKELRIAKSSLAPRL